MGTAQGSSPAFACRLQGKQHMRRGAGLAVCGRAGPRSKHWKSARQSSPCLSDTTAALPLDPTPLLSQGTGSTRPVGCRGAAKHSKRRAIHTRQACARALPLPPASTTTRLLTPLAGGSNRITVTSTPFARVTLELTGLPLAVAESVHPWAALPVRVVEMVLTPLRNSIVRWTATEGSLLLAPYCMHEEQGGQRVSCVCAGLHRALRHTGSTCRNTRQACMSCRRSMPRRRYFTRCFTAGPPVSSG